MEKESCVLELGGNAAAIIDEDADIDYTVDRLIFGAFYQSGQSCIGVQRILAHDRIYDSLKSKLVKKASSLVAGDPKRKDFCRAYDCRERGLSFV